MADKKEPKHKRMYAGSPRIESDENGKKVIKKGPTEAEKKTAEVEGGTDALTREPSGAMMEATHRHAKEMLELSHKHAKEYVEMAQKNSLGGMPETNDKGE